VEQDLIAAHRRPPSRSTMDRIARSLGNDVHVFGEELEQWTREKELVPKSAVAINVGLDRTSIPMEEATEGTEPGGPKIRVAYRMAYVGTFCITNRDCEVLVTRRYAASAHDGPDGVIRRLMADVRHALQQRPALNLGVVQDNAPELWWRMRDALAAVPEARRKRKRETVDRYHFMQRLAATLALLYPKQQRKQQRLYAEWNALLDRTDRALAHIKRAVDAELARRKNHRLSNAVSDQIGCYTLWTPHFRYASLRRHGLHAGSGVTEGACKSLIAMRAKRSGQRWHPRGIRGVLALRSLLDSERLPEFWNLYAGRFRAECKRAA
jgi:hypothetical protein